MTDDLFTIKARKCKRCGGILISAKSISEGYGHSCKMKMRAEARAAEEAKNQLNFYDYINQGGQDESARN